MNPSGGDYHLEQDEDRSYLNDHHQNTSAPLDTRDSSSISNPDLPNSDHNRPKNKEVVVIAKSYYVTHSLRHPHFLHSTKPDDLEHLSLETWLELQAQLGPLVSEQLFLPKSYLLVPLVCLVGTLLWFLVITIATATSHGKGNKIPKIWLWLLVQVCLVAAVWVAFCGWLRKRNPPVDEELTELSFELSTKMVEEEGYRFEYVKCNDSLFATRVFRFISMDVEGHGNHGKYFVDGRGFVRKEQGFQPFQASDIYLEHTVSAFFVMIIFQCLNWFL